tara:strand:+ start:302 stop:499 length:198 start_codon:yes stop_codon:yes gene_type:complete
MSLITYEAVDAAMQNAIAMAENQNPDGSINWNFIDADAFLNIQPKHLDVDKFYCLFEQIAEEKYS